MEVWRGCLGGREEPDGHTPLFLWRQAHMPPHARLHASMHTRTHQGRVKRESKETEENPEAFLILA